MAQDIESINRHKERLPEKYHRPYYELTGRGIRPSSLEAAIGYLESPNSGPEEARLTGVSLVTIYRWANELRDRAGLGDSYGKVRPSDRRQSDDNCGWPTKTDDSACQNRATERDGRCWVHSNSTRRLKNPNWKPDFQLEHAFSTSAYEQVVKKSSPSWWQTSNGVSKTDSECDACGHEGMLYVKTDGDARYVGCSECKTTSVYFEDYE